MNSTNPYFGTDLKQRLTLAGVDKPFKEAITTRNEALMISLLCQVKYTQQQARDTTKNLLLDPSYFLNND